MNTPDADIGITVIRGVPIKAVQELLGHASIEMTMRYAHLSADIRRDAVDVLVADPIRHGNIAATDAESGSGGGGMRRK